MDERQIARLSGPADTIASCPFQTEADVARLSFRNAPYWHHLLVGRHIGVHRPNDKHCNWTARILTRDRRYVQRCLGPALPGVGGFIPYGSAVEAAFDWFEKWRLEGRAADQAARGRTNALNFCTLGDVYTVGHALHDYIRWSKISRSEGGHYNALVLANHHLSGGITHVPLDAFNGDDLQKLALQIIRTPPRFGFSRRQGTPVTRENLTADELRRRKRTYNSVVGILKMAFSHAWDSGKIGSDMPIRCLKRISVVHTPRLLFLNRDECRQLLGECTPALRNLTLAALYTGCRVGELANLRVEDVGDQVFGLRISAFKRSPARYVFLPDEGMAFFLRMTEGKHPKDFVLLSDRGRPWRRQHANLFRRAVRQAKLPTDFVFHGLRHTYASDLIRQGTPLEVIARQLGHADIRTVSETYGHIAEQFREEQVRTRFSPLDELEVDQASERASELEHLWRTVRARDWRMYGFMSPNGESRKQSFVRTSEAILKIFR